MVINKPSNLAVHPSMLYYDNSISNSVKYYFDSISLKKKIRPVNRLDKNTSGLVIFAKCEYIQECLSKQMESNVFKKEYLCLAQGNFGDKKMVLLIYQLLEKIIALLKDVLINLENLLLLIMKF